MSRIHFDAAKVLETVVSERKGLRAAFYKDKVKVDTKVYALASRALKMYEQLKPAFAEVFAPETFTNKYLGMVVAAELLAGKAGKGGGKVRRLVQEKLEVLRRLVDVADENHNNNNSNMDNNQQLPSRFLRFVGSDALLEISDKIKTRLNVQSEIFRPTEIPDVVEFVDPRTVGAVLRDEELNALVSRSAKFFLQDKSTCLTPHVLLHDCRDERQPVHVLDVCSSPGSKALHIFSRLRPGDSLTLVERDRRRFKTLHARLSATLGLDAEKLQSCIGGVKVKLVNEDFLKVKAASVTHINLDPSCSGSGLHTHGSGSSGGGGKDETRLAKLAEMQKTLLRHACNTRNFPNAQVVCYSTCSLFEEENEAVATDKTAIQNFKTDASAPAFLDCFSKTGGFFQVTPERHGCRGFFLAKFKRVPAKKELKLARPARR